MANFHFYIRRMRRLVSTPLVQLIAICLFLYFGIKWAMDHNHDPDEPLPPAATPITSVEDESIDWSKLYYVQYVTSPEYLCNALMVWSEIEAIGSRAQRMMLYPSNWDPNEINDFDSAQGLTPIARLLQSALHDYYVKLQPVDVLHHNNTSQATWSDSYTKLLAFNLTQFDRVLALDSDSIVLQNLDSLFLLPPAPVAMPYVYWGQPTGFSFSSQLLLLQPSAESFAKIAQSIESASPDTYDMDILNSLFKNHILRIPQRPYNLLSGEFRRTSHTTYLSSTTRNWDPDQILSEAKYLHFSDWPVPKPWVRASKDVLNEYMPRCRKSEWFGASDCRDREVWLGLYVDFAKRRKAVCGAGFELQDKVLPPGSIFRNGRWFHPDEVA